jgi:pimeloyl-ACP methyl ester carboxylesterase
MRPQPDFGHDLARMPPELPHEDAGTGAPVVLLHAGVADRTMWSELLPDLVRAGYRAITLDLPGHGANPRRSERCCSSIYEPTLAAGIRLRSSLRRGDIWPASRQSRSATSP